MILDFTLEQEDDESMGKKIINASRIEAIDAIRKRYEGREVAELLIKVALCFLAYVYI